MPEADSYHLDQSYVEQQVWAYLTTILNLPEVSAAAIMGAWGSESGRDIGSPDPTSIEGIFDEHFYIGPKKQNAMSDWQSYAYSHLGGFLNQYYRGEDGKYYPGVGMWGITGPKVTQLFSKAEQMGKNWWDVAPQLSLYNETYFEGRGNWDSGRRSMLANLEAGNGSVDSLTPQAYGLIAYGSPFYTARSVEIAHSIYNKYAGSHFTYSAEGGGSNKLEEFVQKALSYLGTRGAEWQRSHPNWYWPGQWCSCFVSGVAEDVDILGKVFDGSGSAYICAHSVTKYGGQVHNEKTYSPQRGDLVNFTWDGRGASAIDAASFCDHIGIVTEYKNNTVYTVEGNSGDCVAEKQYSRDSSVLACFCTPDWSRVGGFASSGGGFAILGNLFETLNTRKDAILREAAYLEPIYENDKGKKVIKEYQATAEVTDIKLSLANYTELFQAFWKAGVKTLGGSTDISGEYDYSGLEPKVRTIVKFLVDKGLNNAAACGICGNIKFESGFRTEAIGDNGTSVGICQWHNERGAAMIRMAGISNWSNNLTGQLNYLWYELETSYSSVLEGLKSVENTEEGAKKAADIFVRRFEIPANVDSESIKRQEAAAEYFNQIVPIVTSNGSTWTITVNMANLTPQRRLIIQAAFECLAAQTPYVFKGESLEWGLDCSGLTQYCYKKAGVSIEHYSETQFEQAPHVGSVDQASIGDILYRHGHVAIYIGDGEVIEAAGGGSDNFDYAHRGSACSKGPNQYSFTHCLHWDI